eukprot:CAMPEP_0117620700 /NCGR_PEP_ID=MMETSP0784-20121206/87260_1 /TAXON_ID=39447 /ORGANISM="" /LENGTH=71 /DNA_ID=CAMNT_0005424615 /DNA_START=309 /DNA_END=523 /DNA_ORIENTATION=-
MAGSTSVMMHPAASVVAQDCDAPNSKPTSEFQNHTTLQLRTEIPEQGSCQENAGAPQTASRSHELAADCIH